LGTIQRSIMKIGIIVQARLGSNRLPGKTLMPIDSHGNVLEYVINQIKHNKHIKKIIVATTNNSEDDKIIPVTKKLQVDHFRGNSDDVLDRYYQCAKLFSLGIIVRITADNPLTDPQILDGAIEKFFHESPNYLSNVIERTFPFGTEIEIFDFSTLHSVWKNAKLPSEREHVTTYIRNNQQKFKISHIKYKKNISNLRWTVDRKNDLDLIRLISTKIQNRPILLNDILLLFKNEPELKKINEANTPNEGHLKSLDSEKNYN